MVTARGGQGQQWVMAAEQEPVGYAAASLKPKCPVGQGADRRGILLRS